MKHRVVITGMGVVAPNAVGLDNFLEAIQQGRSGITFHQKLQDLKFSCCIGGIPPVSEEIKNKYLTPLQLRGFDSAGILYGCIAGMDAWKDAGFVIDKNSPIDYNSGMVFGTGTSGIEKFREAIYKLDDQKVKRLGSTVVVQTMASGISAYLGGILGMGNQVTTNSSACTTGTEALLMGFERVPRVRTMCFAQCSGRSTLPNMIVTFDLSPSECAISCTCSHSWVDILSGQINARISSERISAAVPGSDRRPASLSRTR